MLATIGLAHDARAASSQLVMTLDTSPGDAPQYLCVVSTMRSCPREATSGGSLKRGAKCDTYELKDLQALDALGSWENGDAAFNPVDREKQVKPTKDRRGLTAPDHPALHRALALLATPTSTACAGKLERCRPRVHLAGFQDTAVSAPAERVKAERAKPFGRITCGEDPANKSGLVAIVSLSYHHLAATSGVQRISLDGTHATLILKHALDEKNYSFSQVLGGDYEYTGRSSLGTRERIVVQLVRRCNLVEVQLPRHLTKPDDTQAVIELLPASSSTATTIIKCTASLRQGAFAMQIPNVSETGLKRLTLGSTPRFEATWTEALPDVPLQFGHRRFKFQWRRDCGTDVWPERAPPGSAWNNRCPRALVEGAACGLATSSHEECSYICEVKDSDYPIALPVDVRFERVRARTSGEHHVEEVLYAWSDRVNASGQTLISSAPATDRKLVVDTPFPSRWRPFYGDVIETIRIVYADGTTADLRPTEDKMWASVRAPENACDGSVRVAVLGTHRNDEHNLETRGGRLTLNGPDEFRNRINSYLVLGLGMQAVAGRDTFRPARGDLMGSIGTAVEMYPSRTWSYGATFMGHASRLAFGELKPFSAKEPELDYVWFLRVDGTANVVWWGHPRVHVGAGIGGGFGVPMYSRDRDQVGTTVSVLFESFARVRLGMSHRWLEFAAGARIREERRFWETDFTGQPTATTREITTPYTAARIRL